MIRGNYPLQFNISNVISLTVAIKLLPFPSCQCYSIKFIFYTEIKSPGVGCLLQLHNAEKGRASEDLRINI